MKQQKEETTKDSEEESELEKEIEEEEIQEKPTINEEGLQEFFQSKLINISSPALERNEIPQQESLEQEVAFAPKIQNEENEKSEYISTKYEESKYNLSAEEIITKENQMLQIPSKPSQFMIPNELQEKKFKEDYVLSPKTEEKEKKDIFQKEFIKYK